MKWFNIKIKLKAKNNTVHFFTYKRIQVIYFLNLNFRADGQQDMFMPIKYDFSDYTKQCQNQFGTTPREIWPQFYFSVGAMRVSSFTQPVNFLKQ